MKNLFICTKKKHNELTGRPQIVVCTQFDRNCFCLFGASWSQRHLTAAIVLGCHCYLPSQKNYHTASCMCVRERLDFLSNQICTNNKYHRMPRRRLRYPLYAHLLHSRPRERIWVSNMYGWLHATQRQVERLLFCNASIDFNAMINLTLQFHLIDRRSDRVQFIYSSSFHWNWK